MEDGVSCVLFLCEMQYIYDTYCGSFWYWADSSTIHDIVYAWANMLCDTLAKAFPTPTRSQMQGHTQRVWWKSLGMHIFSCYWTQRRFLRRLHQWSQSTQYYTRHTNITQQLSGLLGLRSDWNCLGRFNKWWIPWSYQWPNTNHCDGYSCTDSLLMCSWGR